MRLSTLVPRHHPVMLAAAYDHVLHWSEGCKVYSRQPARDPRMAFPKKRRFLGALPLRTSSPFPLHTPSGKCPELSRLSE